MTVGNPKEVPEYELNPLELQVRKVDGISKVIDSSKLQELRIFLLYISSSDVFSFTFFFAGILSSS